MLESLTSGFGDLQAALSVYQLPKLVEENSAFLQNGLANSCSMGQHFNGVSFSPNDDNYSAAFSNLCTKDIPDIQIVKEIQFSHRYELENCYQLSIEDTKTIRLKVSKNLDSSEDTSVSNCHKFDDTKNQPAAIGLNPRVLQHSIHLIDSQPIKEELANVTVPTYKPKHLQAMEEVNPYVLQNKCQPIESQSTMEQSVEVSNQLYKPIHLQAMAELIPQVVQDRHQRIESQSIIEKPAEMTDHDQTFDDCMAIDKFIADFQDGAPLESFLDVHCASQENSTPEGTSPQKSDALSLKDELHLSTSLSALSTTDQELKSICIKQKASNIQGMMAHAEDGFKLLKGDMTYKDDRSNEEK
ncbi:hypothetical protein L7F22_011035 [Adiantum nelumboides]|nr:hypothetical protein [Adiantum nelumboides]